MKSTKFSYLLFSLAMIVALVLAAIPAAPAHALSDSAPQQNTSALTADNHASIQTAGVVVCKTKIVWRHGHRIAVRICHKVPK